MRGRSKKTRQGNDFTQRYADGDMDEDQSATSQRFNQRTKHAQANKTQQTQLARLQSAADIDQLPQGQVTQVYSLYCHVLTDTGTLLCTVRKTLTKIREGGVIVGDLVRYRESGSPEPGAPQAVIEGILPRRTVLTRSDSFKSVSAHPIVANADQVLIVASIKHPTPKWGLIDRMIIASRAGALIPILCLNKMDLAGADDVLLKESQQVLAHYETIGVITVQTSVERNEGIEQVRQLLKDKITVLAGHSGVGKSSLITAVQPSLDIRVGEISLINEKGRHTTTSAQRYALDIGGSVVDTPGVKLFGLWGITAENLIDHFPDVGDDSAPDWRRESYERIRQTLTRSR